MGAVRPQHRKTQYNPLRIVLPISYIPSSQLYSSSDAPDQPQKVNFVPDRAQDIACMQSGSPLPARESEVHRIGRTTCKSFRQNKTPFLTSPDLARATLIPIEHHSQCLNANHQAQECDASHPLLVSQWTPSIASNLETCSPKQHQ
jgi:hypothetical protein